MKRLRAQINLLRERITLKEDENKDHIKLLKQNLENAERDLSKALREINRSHDKDAKSIEVKLREKFGKEVDFVNQQTKQQIEELKKVISKLKDDLNDEIEKNSNYVYDKSLLDRNIRTKNIEIRENHVHDLITNEHEKRLPDEKYINVLNKRIDRIKSDLLEQIDNNNSINNEIKEKMTTLSELKQSIKNEIQEKEKFEREKSLLDIQYNRKFKDIEAKLIRAQHQIREGRSSLLELNKYKARLEAMANEVNTSNELINKYQLEVKTTKEKYNSLTELLKKSLNDEKKKKQNNETRVNILESELEKEKKNVEKEIRNGRYLQSQVEKLKEQLDKANLKIQELSLSKAESQRKLRAVERV